MLLDLVFLSQDLGKSLGHYEQLNNRLIRFTLAAEPGPSPLPYLYLLCEHDRFRTVLVAQSITRLF